MINKPLKAARHFAKAGRRMAKAGYRSLEVTACKEAKRIYQEIVENKSSILKKSDYGNLGFIDYCLDPFPEDERIIY